MTFPLTVVDNQYLLGDHYLNLAINYKNIDDTMNVIRHLELALDAYKKINALEHMCYCCDELKEIYGPDNKVQSQKYSRMSESIKKNPNFDGEKS
jgi:hypothetical protein